MKRIKKSDKKSFRKPQYVSKAAACAAFGNANAGLVAMAGIQSGLAYSCGYMVATVIIAA